MDLRNVVSHKSVKFLGFDVIDRNGITVTGKISLFLGDLMKEHRNISVVWRSTSCPEN